jgi:glycosyltransferase involved in cell wall biosynthesis
VNRIEASATKKVLVVRSELLPYSETFIKEQTLAYRRWKPVLVGVRRVPGLSLEGIEVRLPWATSSTLSGRAYRRLLRDLRIAPIGMHQRLAHEAAALVQVHFGTDAVANWPLIRRLGLPVVVTLHGYDINIDRQWWEQRAHPASERNYPRRLAGLAGDPRVHFVAVSGAIRRRAIEWGIPAERISIQHIGVDLSRFHLAGVAIEKRLPHVLFVGRLVEKKGGEYLIRAFARTRAEVPSAELTFAGDGPLRSAMVRLAAELNVPVKFLGSLSSSNVKEQLDRARVLCLPSVTATNGDAEGFGIALLEAQACGVPVITSARGGAQEGIIDGITGFAFKEKDVGALSEHLTRVLRDDELAASMSGAARRFVEDRFDLRQCTRSLEQLYDTLIEEDSLAAGAMA